MARSHLIVNLNIIEIKVKVKMKNIKGIIFVLIFGYTRIFFLPYTFDQV